MEINEQVYQTVRDQVKNGDLLLYRGKASLSRFIRWVIKSKYSHCGIVVKWNKRLMVIESIGKGGVVVSPLSLNVSKYNGGIEWFTSAEEISHEKRLKIVEFAQDELGTEYNKLKMILFGFGVYFKVRFSRSDKYRAATDFFCSSFIASAFNSIGTDLKENVSDDYVSPKDIAESPALKYLATLKVG